tara:strand:+ start:1817 stop:1987 length:171 start_codon:yes stop_codon:yes gene_type:complete
LYSIGADRDHIKLTRPYLLHVNNFVTQRPTIEIFDIHIITHLLLQSIAKGGKHMLG